MQELGEYPDCGDRIHPKSGLCYAPEEFYEKGIKFYHFNYCARPSTKPQKILKSLKSIEYCLKEGMKVMVHSHAGLDRCALVVCCWLIYKEKKSAHASIDLFLSKRHNSKIGKYSPYRKLILKFEECKLAVDR